MPGTFTIDTKNTFTSALYMSAGPKLKFGSAEQDISATGERKWEVQAAVTFHAEYGMRPVSEVIVITVTGGDDPARGLQAGAPIEFDRLRVGMTAPEARQDGRGIRGGKPYYQAAGIRQLRQAQHPQPAEGKAA